MNTRALLRATASSLAIAVAAIASGTAALAQDATNPAPASNSTQSSSGSTGVAASQSGTSPTRTAPAEVGAPNPQPPGGFTADTIVVTAQKRKENLQDVPVVVTVVNKQLLQDSGVKDIKDLSKLTPGLTVTSTASEATTTARIRGVGTVGDNPGLEPSRRSSPPATITPMAGRCPSRGRSRSSAATRWPAASISPTVSATASTT